MLQHFALPVGLQQQYFLNVLGFGYDIAVIEHSWKVRHLSGEYRVRDVKLKPLFRQVVTLLERFEKNDVEYIARVENKHADKLANKAMNLGKDCEGDL